MDIENDPAYVKMKAAVDEFFSSTDRSVAQTREGLESMRDEINMLLEALPE